MAIIPGVALGQLWQNISNIDTAFLIITVLVVMIAFIGLLLGLFMSLNQRSRELGILRVMGAHPTQIAAMLVTEAFFITSLGVIIGCLLSIGLGHGLAPLIEARTGLLLTTNRLSLTEISLASSIILFGVIIGLIPAVLAYKKRAKQADSFHYDTAMVLDSILILAFASASIHANPNEITWKQMEDLNFETGEMPDNLGNTTNKPLKWPALLCRWKWKTPSKK